MFLKYLLIEVPIFFKHGESEQLVMCGNFQWHLVLRQAVCLKAMPTPKNGATSAKTSDRFEAFVVNLPIMYYLGVGLSVKYTF